MLKKCGRCVVPIQIDIGINNCVGCVLQNLRCAHLDIVCNTWDNGLALEVRKCAYARTFASSASSGKVTTQPSHIMPDWGQLDVHPPVGLPTTIDAGPPKARDYLPHFSKLPTSLAHGIVVRLLCEAYMVSQT